MDSGTVKTIGRAACATALAALSALSFAACSSDGDNDDVGRVEDVGFASEAINKNCSGPASTTVNGGFAKAYTSDATYSDCYKGKVVEIDGYSATYAIGGHTQVRWAGAAPSTANCLGSYLSGYLFEQQGNEWVFIKSKAAHGDLLLDDQPGDVDRPPPQPLPDLPVTPIKPGDLGGPIKGPPVLCGVPSVYFYTSDMVAGRNYRIAATARLPNGTTQKISFRSVAGTCGHASGDQCCTSGDRCDGGLECNSQKKCTDCGGSGELCCGGSGCDSGSLVCKSGSCTACGASGQTCCAGNDCDGALTCQSGVCKTPPCGGSGEMCCAGNDCDGALTCQSGVCKTPPCGGSGQACCSSGAQCTGGLSCQSGTCKTAPQACGGLGAACCAGNTCISKSLACTSGVCSDPPEFCAVAGDHCCQEQQFPYCNNKYYSNINCNNQLTCSVP
jgi:hypothetical protein